MGRKHTHTLIFLFSLFFWCSCLEINVSFTSICDFVRQCSTKWLPVPLPTQHPTNATMRWFSRWWSGSIVSTPTPKAAVVPFIQSTYKKRLSCGVAPFSYPLPSPLHSCLGCIPPLIGLSSLRFYAVAYSLFYCLCAFVCVFYFFLSIATMSFAGYFLLVRSFLSAFLPFLRTYFRFDLVWFRLSCNHGWIRSGSVNVR